MDLLLGLFSIVLFERLARHEEEPVFLWSVLAGVAFFGPAFFGGILWGLGGIVLLGTAFTVRTMTREHGGGRKTG